MRSFYAIGTSGTILQGGANSGALLHEILVGTGVASSVVTVYDGQDTSGAVRAVIDASASGRWPFHGAWFKNGCYITVTGGAAKVTAVIE